MRILLALLLVASAAWAEPARLYRYVNGDGVVVVDFRIPPEYIANGYEILNQDGMVVEVVPRQLSDAERAELSVSERRAEEDAAAQQAARERDESLLRRYSSVEDIEAARDRSLRDLRIRISILSSNRRALRQKVENHQSRIAAAERAGEQPAQQDIDSIEALKDEIAYVDRAISERTHEVDDVSEAYERDIARLTELRELVERRRELSAPGEPSADKEPSASGER